MFCANQRAHKNDSGMKANFLVSNFICIQLKVMGKSQVAFILAVGITMVTFALYFSKQIGKKLYDFKQPNK